MKSSCTLDIHDVSHSAKSCLQDFFRLSNFIIAQANQPPRCSDTAPFVPCERVSHAGHPIQASVQHQPAQQIVEMHGPYSLECLSMLDVWKRFHCRAQHPNHCLDFAANNEPYYYSIQHFACLSSLRFIWQVRGEHPPVHHSPAHHPTKHANHQGAIVLYGVVTGLHRLCRELLISEPFKNSFKQTVSGGIKRSKGRCPPMHRAHRKLLSGQQAV